MRNPRLIAPAGQPGIYHVFNRIAHRAMLFDNAEKNRFLRLLDKVEAFSGIKVLTFCVMSDHFHLLVMVPERQTVDDEGLLRRLELIQSPRTVAARKQRWERLENEGEKALADAERDAFRARMYDLSKFVKTLKELYTEQYNKRTGHVGTLWTGRFGSVCVTRDYHALMSVASYIDFNPVKARMTESPFTYRWNGVSRCPGRIVELVRIARGDSETGDRPEIAGVRHLTDEECLEVYRHALNGRLAKLDTAQTDAPDAPNAPTKESIQRKIETKELLTFREMLHCDMALFTRGTVIGSFASLRAYIAHTGNRDRRKPAPYVSGLPLATLRPLRGVIIRAL